MLFVQRDLWLRRWLVPLAAFLFPVVGLAQAKPVQVSIDVFKTGSPISKYIYGQFLEHAGNLVNESGPATQVRAKYEQYQEYLKRIPALRAKPVPIAIGEWAYTFGPGYKVVPAYAWAFHEMFRHSELFQLAAFTFATSMLSENRTEAVLSPTRLLFEMYRDHFGAIPVQVGGDSPQPKPAYPAGGDQPAVNPGSDTYPLDVSAALSEDRKTLTSAVINPSETEQNMNLSISEAKLATQGKLWQMPPKSIDATNTVGKSPEVEVTEQPLGAALAGTISVPPFSVTIYSYAVQ